MKVELQTREDADAPLDHQLLCDLFVKDDKGSVVATLCLWYTKNNEILITGEGVDFDSLQSCLGENSVTFVPAFAQKRRPLEVVQ